MLLLLLDNVCGTTASLVMMALAGNIGDAVAALVTLLGGCFEPQNAGHHECYHGHAQRLHGQSSNAAQAQHSHHFAKHQCHGQQQALSFVLFACLCVIERKKIEITLEFMSPS